jgi:hypothetical protein
VVNSPTAGPREPPRCSRASVFRHPGKAHARIFSPQTALELSWCASPGRSSIQDDHKTEGQLLQNRGPSCCGILTGGQTVGLTQWQIQCQIRGIRGIRGEQTPNEFSKLLMRLILPPGSNPSLSAKIQSQAVSQRLKTRKTAVNQAI